MCVEIRQSVFGSKHLFTCFCPFSKQIRSIDRKQEVPHDGPMCDLLWSDPEGLRFTTAFTLHIYLSFVVLRIGETRMRIAILARIPDIQSTLMQLLFSFDRGFGVEKTLMHTRLPTLVNSCSCLTGA